MFTYVCLGTNDLARSAKFYDAVFTTLGIGRCDTSGEPDWAGTIGWGQYEARGATELALWLTTPFNKQPATAGNGTMIALKASSWDQVKAFHAAALKAGGSSEGAPGLRPQYNKDFYACYVRDPDGNKLAVVCRGRTR
jgi:catechol 2,3-dioxygenase-like lactoylglutathione lyase family enzyme